MSTLHLTLKKQWFDMILSGVKTEEYRDIKPYYNLSEHAWRSCLQRAKVIGNQYENPELLEYKEED